MSRLLKQAQQDKERKRLQKAGDADRDPADLDVGGATPWSEPAQDTGDPASDPASVSASGKGSENASDPAGGSAGGNADLSASGSDGGSAGGKASGNKGAAQVKDKPGRGQRRVGRPRGPDRVKLSVRIRQELDAQLSEAVEQTSMSPQYIVEEALERHFRALGLAPKRRRRNPSTNA